MNRAMAGSGRLSISSASGRKSMAVLSDDPDIRSMRLTDDLSVDAIVADRLDFVQVDLHGDHCRQVSPAALPKLRPH